MLTFDLLGHGQLVVVGEEGDHPFSVVRLLGFLGLRHSFAFDVGASYAVLLMVELQEGEGEE